MQLYAREAYRQLQYGMTKRYVDKIYKIIINNNN